MGRRARTQPGSWICLGGLGTFIFLGGTGKTDLRPMLNDEEGGVGSC